MSWLKALKWKTPKTNEVYHLATKMGLERRRNARIKYPPHGPAAGLPRVFYMEKELKVQDLSIGGVCLHDPAEILGPNIGQDVSLRVAWPSFTRAIRSRIVGRVDDRRHVQFLDIPTEDQKTISERLFSSNRGRLMKRAEYQTGALTLDACELWFSLSDDSVTLFDHPHLLSSIVFHNENLVFYKGSLPVRQDTPNKVIEPTLIEDILIFLANIPEPSPRLIELLNELWSVRNNSKS